MLGLTANDIHRHRKTLVAVHASVKKRCLSHSAVTLPLVNGDNQTHYTVNKMTARTMSMLYCNNY